jgi:hypothetical protein
MKIPPIIPKNPLGFTCTVCGSPLGALVTGLPGTEGKKCSVCHEKVCDKHFVSGKDVCTSCDHSGWCETPKGPHL